MFKFGPLLSVSAALVFAAVAPARAAVTTSVTGSVSDGVDRIPYRLFEPQNTAPGQKVPLVLYLHGMGERGTDNLAQTAWISNLTSKTSSGQYSAYVLAPQLNTNMWFASSKSTMSEGMSLTMQALKQAMSNPNIDTSRIYVMGASMGSFGTWDILRRNPSLFAAAVPMSGGGDPSTASAIKNVPVWAFHGSADDVVGVQTTRDMIQALKDAGGSPNYTEIEGGGHVIWPEVMADPANTLYSWLFDQHLGEDPLATLADPLATLADPTVDLSSAVEDPTTPSFVQAAVPEPTSLSLLAVGTLALLNRRRRSRQPL